MNITACVSITVLHVANYVLISCVISISLNCKLFMVFIPSIRVCSTVYFILSFLLQIFCFIVFFSCMFLCLYGFLWCSLQFLCCTMVLEPY